MEAMIFTGGEIGDISMADEEDRSVAVQKEWSKQAGQIMMFR
jgi:hypothetical protein